MMYGHIMSCTPGPDGGVHVSTGAFLPRYHQVRILQRYLRNTWHDNPGATFVPLSCCTLDASHNGKFLGVVPTLADRAGKLYKEAVTELATFQNKSTNVVDFSDVGARRADDMMKGDDCSPEVGRSLSDANAISRKREREPAEPQAEKPGFVTKSGNGELPIDDRRADDGVKPASKAHRVDGGDTNETHKVTPCGQKCHAAKIDRQVKRLEWRSNLDGRLADCAEARNRRRADLDTIDANEKALKMAIAVRQRLDAILLTKNASVEELVDEYTNELDCSRERLWDYLNGNSNNFLSVAALNGLSAKWQHWLDRTACL